MKTERVRVREKRNRQKKTQKWQKKTNPSRCIPTRGNHVYQTFRTIVTKPLQSAYKILRAYVWLCHPVADPGGANPAMAPSKLAMKFGPKGGQSGHGTNNESSSVNVPKF